MFIINLTYKVPLEQVQHHIDAHMVYLKEQYTAGHFHASGKKVPRTGGIILSQMKDKEALEVIVQQDPFCIHDLDRKSVV